MERFLKSKYKIGQKIAENPFSLTYQGSNLGNDHPLIIKIYKRGTLNSSLISRMKQKVKELAAINQAEIVKLVDGDYGWQGFYYVREFVKGASLQELLNSGRSIPADKVLEIAIDICRALEAAHRCGIIHGGLKPSNIFFDAQGKARVADFVIEGEIRQAMPQKAISVLENASFASPEEILGNPASALSDIYSLGRILWLMLPDTSTLPRYLQEILAKALKTDPKLRFSSVAQFRESLANKNLAFNPPAHEEYLQIFEKSINEDEEEFIKGQFEKGDEGGQPRRERLLNWLFVTLLLVSIFSGLLFVFLSGR